MQTNDYLTSLGLAMRAGKVAYGETTVKDAVFTKHTALVHLASDAGNSLRRTFERLCREKHIPLIVLPEEKHRLGAAIGKEMCSVAAVLNKGLADSIAAKAANHIGGGHI